MSMTFSRSVEAQWAVRLAIPVRAWPAGRHARGLGIGRALARRRQRGAFLSKEVYLRIIFGKGSFGESGLFDFFFNHARSDRIY